MFRQDRTMPPTVPQYQPADNGKISPEQRKALREWLSLPETKLAFSLAETTKPTVFLPVRTVQPELNAQLGMQRLHQIQGWESYRNFLLTLDRTPKEIEELREKFSDKSFEEI